MMRVCEAFAREGIDVEMWVPRRRNDMKKINPFEYHAIEQNFLLKKLPVLDVMGIIPGRAGFFLMLLSFSIVVFFYILFSRARRDSIFYFFDLRDAWANTLLSKNVFSEIHMYYKSSVEFVNRWGFSRVRGLVVATSTMMKDIQMQYGINIARMIHAPCAVDFKRFGITTSKEEARKELGLPIREHIILYAGHLFPVKGVHVLFEVHPLLDSGEKIYFVGGTDSDIEDFSAKWKKAGSPKNVVIVGRKPHREIPLWLRAADVLVIPNTAKESAGSVESSPSKLIEYMASGRPIVASDVPGIRDVLSDSMGYFFEPDNPEAIGKAIREVFTDFKQAEEKSKRAQIAAKDLSWEARARKIKKFIESCIETESTQQSR